MRARHRLSLLVPLSFFLALPRLAWPETPDAFANYLTNFEQIHLPNFGRVYCIIRDDLGFLWFGTTRGLCRYDGYEARVFSNGASLNMKQQVITACIKLNERSLLLGTLDGLWTFNLESGMFTRFPEAGALADTGIADLSPVMDSVVFVGTTSHGLLRYNLRTRALQRFTTDDGLSSDNITSLFADESGTLWIGTLSGLNAFPMSSTMSPYPVGVQASLTSFSNEHITALCVNSRNELWIGTNTGIYTLNLQSGNVHQLTLPSHTQHTTYSIAEGPSGRMWLAISELGLFAYDHGKLSEFITLHDPARTLITARVLYPDPIASRGGNLLMWIGTRTGVNKVVLATNPFASYLRNRHRLQLGRGAVLSLCEDHGGILWLGLWGGGVNGLRRVDGTYQRVYAIEKNPSASLSLPNNDVGCVMEDRSGRLWLGTPEGASLLNTQRQLVATFQHVDGDSTTLVDNGVHSILEDRSGTIWISTVGGLSAMHPGETGTFRNYFYREQDATPSGKVGLSDLMEDGFSNLWIGTYGVGLIKRDSDGVFTRYASPGDSLGSEMNFIYRISAGQKGNLWLSTRAGVVLFDPLSGGFEHVEIEQLNDAVIFGIHEDHSGELWLSTSNGLMRFNPRTRTFALFDEKQGFPFRELRSAFRPSSRGMVLVGGLDGFVEFDPDSVSPVTTPPKIVVTGFSVFGTERYLSFRSNPHISLSYDENFFSCSFAALDYINPSQNKFAYKMDGVDPDWIQAGTRNYASYTNLDPGTYTFRIRGANSIDVWDQAGTALTIAIAPPYWAAWWFRALLALTALALIYFVYKYRLQKALEVERMRLRIADDLHDDVGSNLSTIAMISRVLQRTPGLGSVMQTKLAEIYETAIKTSEGMKDIVWFIKPKDDTIDDLLLRMKDTASSLLADIRHEFQTTAPDNHIRVTIDFKRNFFLAFKEIITNIVKHASATQVRITVEQHGPVLEVLVQDNGRGFDDQTIRPGNGLGSIRTRASALGGTVEVTSLPNNGTRVRFSGKI